MNNSTSSSSSITAFVPGGVVTTQNISTVIKPKENNNSMQFVKIQTPDLHKSAAEQIRVADESKISKNKIKEVEEEWQSNLLNWKSKRRQQFVGIHPFDKDNDDDQNNNGHENGRKIKTFAEMIEQRARTGNRLNFHLQRYIASDDSEHSHGEEDEPDQISGGAEKQPTNETSGEEEQDHSKLLNELDLRDQEDAITHSTTIGTINTHSDKQRETQDTQNDSLPVNSKPQTPTQRQRIDTIESDTSSEDDDVRGEKEEQKHLQRVAFVAKLKAFERMTQPSMEEPKFVPTRPSKQTPPPPLPIKQQSPVLSQHVQPRQTQPQQKLQQQSIQQKQQPPPPAKVSPQVSPPAQQLQSIPSPRHSQPQPLQSTPKLLQQESPPCVSPREHSFRDEQPQSPILHHPVQTRQAPSHQLPSRLSQQQTPLQLMPQTQQHQQPQQQHQHQQQHTHKEDKAQDRTVLSVSGKKRCSSCREELGRGAAAFVIESLNLVYHTNCFRCSVCHVNLSNGFRGVDVRVHAGALHCQNCYSKDGLNYSRV